MAFPRRRAAGLSLPELVVVVVLATILMGLSLSSLQQARPKTSSLALARALAEELTSARQRSIAEGHPVAVGIPRDGSEVADSVFRLEGWNAPRVTRTLSYAGDYPRLGFAAAGWSGASFSTGTSPPPLTKFAGFRFDSWLPAANHDDSIFCFTPDGGVVSNSLPSLGGRYTVVVAGDPVVENRTIVAATEPCVIFISPGGAVEISKQLPGAVLRPGTQGVRAGARSQETLTGSARIRLSRIVVRPAAPAQPVDAYCTPGEQVTFELYAYDPEGRELFTQWKQVGPSGKKGNFTFPRGYGGPLNREVERMEFLEGPPASIDWNGADPPEAGCFRSRWTWTVPQDSAAGDQYTVEADVQDATGQATIENPPPTVTFTTGPEGRLIAEIWNPTLGRWELVRMNRNGTARQVLTPPGVEEVMPSVDKSSTKLALLQGPVGDPDRRCVKVRSLAGGGEFTIAGPGRYTTVSISPDGGWISYRLDDAGVPGKGRVFVQRLDPGSPVFSREQTWRSLPVDPWPIEPDRAGWSPDGRYVLWANGGSGGPPDGGIIELGELTSGGDVVNVRTLYTNNHNQGMIYAPTVFDPGSGPRVLFTISTTNPVSAHIPFNPAVETYGNARNLPPNETPSQKIDLSALPDSTGSGDFDDTLACVSPDGRAVVLPRVDRPNGQHRSAIIARWNDGVGNFVANPSEANTIDEEIRSVVWIP